MHGIFGLSGGLSRSHHGSPAESVKVQELYGTHKLFSGLVPLALTRSETRVVDRYYQCVIMNLQRVHRNSLWLGLPSEAILHQKQLTLFCMICDLPGDSLNAHTRHVLVIAKNSWNSWFLKIQDLCLLYRLNYLLKLLDSPSDKARFKMQVKEKEYSQREGCWPSLHMPLYVQKQHTQVPPSCLIYSQDKFWMPESHSICMDDVWSFLVGIFDHILVTDQAGAVCQAETCGDVNGDLEHWNTWSTVQLWKIPEAECGISC